MSDSVAGICLLVTAVLPFPFWNDDETGSGSILTIDDEAVDGEVSDEDDSDGDNDCNIYCQISCIYWTCSY